MNAISPAIIKVRKIIATKLSPYFRHAPVKRRRMEVQLEFPWQTKR